MLALFGTREAHAVLTGSIVGYNPVSEAVYGTLPYSTSYTLNVTSPALLPAGSVTVKLRLTATTFPVGDAATASSYISFSTSTLTFTGPSQTVPVTVTMNFPPTALIPGVPSGAYNYLINTDGWPTGMIDRGATISSSVTLPTPPAANPPTVAITSPTDGSTFTYQPTDFPATIPFQFTASTDSSSPLITSVTAAFGTSLQMSSIPVSTSGVGTASVSGSGSFSVSAPGTYMLQVSAANSVGPATDTNTYVVYVAAPPPTVSISSPNPGDSFTYRVGSSPTVVNFNFSATAGYGMIRTLTATVDGVNTPFTAINLNTATASGSIPLPYTTAGSHTLSVAATDDNNSASAQSNFVVNVVAPLPAVTITAPTANQVFTIPVGSSTFPVPYSFTTTVQNGFGVDSVGATIGNTVLSPATLGMGTATATSSGTVDLPVGTYTLTATGGSVGVAANASVTFVVKAAVLPPSVVVNSPAPNYSLAIIPGTTANVPLTFTGTSNNPGGVITSLAATLDGAPVAVSSSTLGNTVATGTATLAVTATGTHHILVTATDAYSSATSSTDFTITFLTPHQVTGTVFFDIDGNGVQNGADFGLGTVSVSILDANNQVVATAVTDPAGSYAFAGLYPGSYTVVASSYPGLIATTPVQQVVTMASADLASAPIGYKLDFCALQRMKASGCSLGFWKNNVSKAISGRTHGVQVSAASVAAYTTAIAQLALSPFDGLTMKSALTIMSSRSCAPSDLLAKQLVPAEYNYENGAYINGNATLTFAFVAWGEAVLLNSNSFSSSYVLWAKDWFDAYNNSYGYYVQGPGSYSSGSCSGSSGSSGEDDGGENGGDD